LAAILGFIIAFMVYLYALHSTHSSCLPLAMQFEKEGNLGDNALLLGCVEAAGLDVSAASAVLLGNDFEQEVYLLRCLEALYFCAACKRRYCSRLYHQVPRTLMLPRYRLASQSFKEATVSQVIQYSRNSSFHISIATHPLYLFFPTCLGTHIRRLGVPHFLVNDTVSFSGAQVFFGVQLSLFQRQSTRTIFLFRSIPGRQHTGEGVFATAAIEADSCSHLNLLLVATAILITFSLASLDDLCCTTGNFRRTRFERF
jgi:hypothetical protein